MSTTKKVRNAKFQALLEQAPSRINPSQLRASAVQTPAPHTSRARAAAATAPLELVSRATRGGKKRKPLKPKQFVTESATAIAEATATSSGVTMVGLLPPDSCPGGVCALPHPSRDLQPRTSSPSLPTPNEEEIKSSLLRLTKVGPFHLTTLRSVISDMAEAQGDFEGKWYISARAKRFVAGAMVAILSSCHKFRIKPNLILKEAEGIMTDMAVTLVCALRRKYIRSIDMEVALLAFAALHGHTSRQIRDLKAMANNPNRVLVSHNLKNTSKGCGDAVLTAEAQIMQSKALDAFQGRNALDSFKDREEQFNKWDLVKLERIDRDVAQQAKAKARLAKKAKFEDELRAIKESKFYQADLNQREAIIQKVASLEEAIASLDNQEKDEKTVKATKATKDATYANFFEQIARTYNRTANDVYMHLDALVHCARGVRMARQSQGVEGARVLQVSDFAIAYQLFSCLYKPFQAVSAAGQAAAYRED